MFVSDDDSGQDSLFVEIARLSETFFELAGCEFQAPQKCLRLIKV